MSDVKRYNVVQRWLGHDHAVLEREYVDHGDSVDATDYDRLRAERDGLRADAERWTTLLRHVDERRLALRRWHGGGLYANANAVRELIDAALASTTAGSQPTGEG